MGKKLRDPIIYSQRLPEGTDSAQPGGGLPGNPGHPRRRCQRRWGACGSVFSRGASPAAGAGAGCRNPAGWKRLAIPCCRATRCLPACVRSCAMGMKSGSPARALLGFPTLRADAIPSPGEKAFCTTWDEEQGSCGREDDPAGRMVHLGAAVD